MKNNLDAEYILDNSLLSPLGQAKTVEDLLKIAIPLRTTLKVRYSYGEESIVPNYYEEEKEKHFNSNSGVTSFYYNGILYSIPYTKKVIYMLIGEGFQPDKNMYVLSDLVPTEYEDYWEKLKREADGVNALETIKNIEELVNKPYERDDNKKVEEISTESINRSFRIPDNGIKIIVDGRDSEYKPTVGIDVSRGIITNANLIGTCFVNNGVMVFNTPSGTYVTRSKKVMDEVNSKYVSRATFVPFSNGEVPSEQREFEVLTDVLSTDEDYERRHKDEKNDIKKEIRELTFKKLYEQQTELDDLKKQLAEANRIINDLKREKENKTSLGKNTYQDDYYNTHGYYPSNENIKKGLF